MLSWLHYPAINLINGIVLQFALVPIKNTMTSTLVGFKTYQDQKEKRSLSLKPFDPTVMGGNLVTSRGFLRQLMIAVRVSVVVTVRISNIHRTGRAKSNQKNCSKRTYTVFVPGVIPTSETNVRGLRERLGAYVYCSAFQSDGKTNISTTQRKGFIYLNKQMTSVRVRRDWNFRNSTVGDTNPYIIPPMNRKPVFQQRFVRVCANLDIIQTINTKSVFQQKRSLVGQLRHN